MLYCRCGAYLLWDRDHWVCGDCGDSPWRCKCVGDTKRYEVRPKDVGVMLNQVDGIAEEETILEKAKNRVLAALRGDVDESPVDK